MRLLLPGVEITAADQRPDPGKRAITGSSCQSVFTGVREGSQDEKREGRQPGRSVYDRLLTKHVQEQAPEFIQNHLEQAEKAIKVESSSFDERGEVSEEQEGRQEGLESFSERGENQR